MARPNGISIFCVINNLRALPYLGERRARRVGVSTPRAAWHICRARRMVSSASGAKHVAIPKPSCLYLFGSGIMAARRNARNLDIFSATQA